MHSDTLEGAAVEIGAQTPVAVVETDAYCPTCGYNLHQQPVSRDERLGILITRCPECGKFAAATALTDVKHRGINRLATFGLVLYVLFALYVAAVIVFGLGGLQYAFMEAATGNSQSRELTLILFAGGALAFVTGVLLATFLWHWKRLWWAIITVGGPSAIGVSINLLYLQDNSWLQWTRHRLHFQIVPLLVEIAGLGAGLFLGRVIARGIIAVVLPPRMREQFAFLWLVDGRPLRKPGLDEPS